jgi:phosphotransacetylase
LRVVAAARRLKLEGLADPTLISNDVISGVETIDPAGSPRLMEYAALYRKRRASKGVTEMEADAIAREPLYFAALMVAMGDAHGTVGAAFTQLRKRSGPHWPRSVLRRASRQFLAHSSWRIPIRASAPEAS